MSSSTTSVCSYIFLVLRDHGLYLFNLKKEYSLCAKNVSGEASLIAAIFLMETVPQGGPFSQLIQSVDLPLWALKLYVTALIFATYIFVCLNSMLLYLIVLKAKHEAIAF